MKLSPSRLAAAGYAEYHPADTNSTAEGRSHNRRVDIGGFSEFGTAQYALGKALALGLSPSGKEQNSSAPPSTKGPCFPRSDWSRETKASSVVGLSANEKISRFSQKP